ncbi:MAG: glutathione S-transferase [Gammaproteobacteria bacterium]|nr:glutathione S-transferase [Gammaproteobacteria bacterium]
MAELILHHSLASPFAEKVRLMLGFKGLAWRSVLVPEMMPMPDVLALTGGYGRTPILQIGADIYCDTALITTELETIKPKPSLFAGNALAHHAIVYWAETALRDVAASLAYQGPGSVDLHKHFDQYVYIAEFYGISADYGAAGGC